MSEVQVTDQSEIGALIKSKLALAFLVKNEGRYALQMLKSVLPIVGFVSCVDTESDDDTVDMISGYLDAVGINYKISIEKFTRFDEMRNKALENIPKNFEWVMMLDADEILLEKDFGRLLALISQGEHDAWIIARYNWIDKIWGELSPSYPDYQGRLFRNYSQDPIRYIGRVHEILSGYRNLGIVEAGPLEGGEFGNEIHIHHMKFFQKNNKELADRENLYHALTEQQVADTIRADCIKKIWYGVDPFENADSYAGLEDFQGWRSEHAYLTSSIEEVRPGIIVEIGVWKGGSTIFMADYLRNNAINGVIISVDTWLGSSDHWLQKQWFDSLRIKNGHQNIYRTFIANIMARKLQNYVVPLPIDSINASKILEARGIRPSLLHIDAGHDYESVISDLRAWWPLLSDGGILIGDDYDPVGGSWPGVLNAFHDFFHTDKIENMDGKCLIRKA
jgi:cephalosporin hydroxylase